MSVEAKMRDARADQQRQTDELADELGKFIKAYADLQEFPSLNAVISALSSAQGQFIASIEDAGLRKGVITQSDKIRRITIRDNIDQPRAKTVVVNSGTKH